MRNSAGKSGQTLAAQLSHNPLETDKHTHTHPTRSRVSVSVLQVGKHQGCDIGRRGECSDVTGDPSLTIPQGPLGARAGQGQGQSPLMAVGVGAMLTDRRTPLGGI